MRGDELSDGQILNLVVLIDTALFREGMDIKRRSWEVPEAAMKELGYISYVMAGVGQPKVLQRIQAAFNSLYRPQDRAMGGHIGVFMYRDIFARISIPHIVGRVGIRPLEFIELTPIQLQVMQNEPEELAAYIDQFSDVFDIQYGTEILKKPFGKMELVQRFIGLARLHLHGAAAVLTGGYDYRGAVQSAILATELALKAGVAAQGLDEAEIKGRFGHDLPKLADFVGESWPVFDGERVKRVISAQPNYVPNRYAATQPPRRDAGHLAMGAQFLVAEVVRQISKSDFHTRLKPPQKRSYPA